MSHYLDISVKGPVATWTKKAKPFEVSTQILLKVPAWDLTTIRLLGTNFQITEFLRTLTVTDANWTEEKVRMFVKAIKPVTPDVAATPDWKNRGLIENRLKAAQ